MVGNQNGEMRPKFFAEVLDHETTRQVLILLRDFGQSGERESD